MSRFEDADHYEEPFPNAGALWWANLRRSLKSKKGQRDLRELERALLALPEPKLISGALALNGQVCTVGALVLARRVESGEEPDAVLVDLEADAECTCWHPKSAHDDDGCRDCRAAVNPDRAFGRPRVCTKFELEECGSADGGDMTAEAGKSVGTTYSLAWRLAYLNDVDFDGCTPEERYDKVLAWVRKQILTPA